MTFRLLQISDTHFGTEQPSVMAALETHVKTFAVDLLVVSGDITQRARNGQFAAAGEFLRRLQGLGIPRQLVIPGNHDLPLFNLAKRLLSPYGNYRRHFGRELEPTLETDQLLLIGLNTTHPLRHKNGRVSQEQIRRVAERLRATDDQKTRIVVAHQPFGAKELSDLRNLQQGAHEALRRWAECGLDLVMGGHIHLPYVLPLSAQYPDIAREIWIVQAGTTLSSRLRGGLPNSFNRLDIEARGKVQAQQWDYQDGSFAVSRTFALGW